MFVQSLLMLLLVARGQCANLDAVVNTGTKNDLTRITVDVEPFELSPLCGSITLPDVVEVVGSLSTSGRLKRVEDWYVPPAPLNYSEHNWCDGWTRVGVAIKGVSQHIVAYEALSYDLDETEAVRAVCAAVACAVLNQMSSSSIVRFDPVDLLGDGAVTPRNAQRGGLTQIAKALLEIVEEERYALCEQCGRRPYIQSSRKSSKAKNLRTTCSERCKKNKSDYAHGRGRVMS